MDETAREVLDFWFGGDEPGKDADGVIASRQEKLWWAGGAAEDEAVRERFAETHRQATRGVLDHWTRTPRGRLALVIVLDQFSRVLHRGSAEAFAYDHRALALSLQAQSYGDDQGLRPIERVFLYMPMEHAESLPVQDQSVQRFEVLLDTVPAESRPAFEGFLDFARRHRDIILRFGRFPHRNLTLGRASTPAELEFLQQPGSSF